MFDPSLVTRTGGVASAGRSECRVYERHACGLETSCQPPAVWGGKDLKWSARIHDLSQGGLSLILCRRFERGTGLAVELPATESVEGSTVLVRVVRVRPHEDGGWLLGCSFVSELSEEEMKSFLPPAEPAPPAAELAPPPPPPPPAAQPEPIRPSVLAEPRPTALSDVSFRGRLSDGRVVKRRIKQLHLSQTWPLTPGQVLIIHLRNRGLSTGVRFKLESCTLRGERWVLECAILHPSPEEVWQALGRRKQAN